MMYEERKAFWKVKELAARWEVTDVHIRTMIRKGDIKVIRIGRAVRIPADEVRRYEGANVNQ